MKKLLSLTVVFLAWTMIMCQGSENLKNFQKAPAYECGHRNINDHLCELSGDSGIQTKYIEFPWMAMVLIPVKVKGGIVDIYQCAGSIMHPRVVLVTAKCVENKPAETLKITAGEWDTQNNIDRNVSDIIVHENYTQNKEVNNIALLILTEPIEFNENVYSICLPPPDTQFDNQKCLLTGWGRNKASGNYQVNLKKIDLPVISRDQCQSTLRNILKSPNSELDPSLICTEGTFGNDTCMVYMGSPLACPFVDEKDRYYQAGLFIWDVGCAKGNPAVHINVAKFSDWIGNKLLFF